MDDPVCPICKGDCSDFYFDVNGEICGCNRCITVMDAWEYKQQQDELEADYYREVWGADR